MGRIVPRLTYFDEGQSHQQIQCKLGIMEIVAKIHCYSVMGQQISSTMVGLMQGAINMSSSFIVFVL
jgi:hypothetical protein